MERTPVKSNLIRSIGYDPATRVLQVEFLRRQTEAMRAVYNYADVPQHRFDELMHGNPARGDEKHSVGSYFLKMIKPNYKFTKIEEKNEDQSQGTTPPATA